MDEDSGNLAGSVDHSVAALAASMLLTYFLLLLFDDCHTRAMLGPSHRETRSAVSHTVLPTY